jgi:hypothetical protein
MVAFDAAMLQLIDGAMDRAHGARAWLAHGALIATAAGTLGALAAFMSRGLGSEGMLSPFWPAGASDAELDRAAGGNVGTDAFREQVRLISRILVTTAWLIWVAFGATSVGLVAYLLAT